MTPDALKHAVEQIEMDEAMQARVLRRSLDYAKEHDTMKQKRNFKRIAIIAVAAVMALSVTALAAARSQVKVSWYAPEDEVLSLDESREKLAELGSGLTLPESFSNGYAFEGAQSHYTALGMEQEGSGDEPVFSFSGDAGTEGMSCIYGKDGERVNLSMTPGDWTGTDEPAHDAESGLTETETAVVCEDGVIVDSAEADGAGDAAGTAVFTEDGWTELEVKTGGLELRLRYSEEPVTISQMTTEGDTEDASVEETMEGVLRTVRWECDGMTYELSQMEGSLTEEDLFQMALELYTQE